VLQQFTRNDCAGGHPSPQVVDQSTIFLSSLLAWKDYLAFVPYRGKVATLADQKCSSAGQQTPLLLPEFCGDFL
jgi:hypothetical protein